MPELAIDRAIAAVRPNLEHLERLDRLQGGYLSAVRDCRAALAILEAAKAWDEAWPEPPKHLRVALHNVIRGDTP